VSAEPVQDASPGGLHPPRRGVLALAGPALVVLAAEPLYLLVDTAVVGHLGTVALGGLAVGGGLLAWAAALLNFLAYGTTARAARRAGAGDRVGPSRRASRPRGSPSGWGSPSSCSSKSSPGR
jgi:Na+-driven multidrug efflux pump